MPLDRKIIKWPYSCIRCNKRFSILKSWKQHMTTAHMEGHTFNCSNCSTGFKNRQALIQHLSNASCYDIPRATNTVNVSKLGTTFNRDTTNNPALLTPPNSSEIKLITQKMISSGRFPDGSRKSRVKGGNEATKVLEKPSPFIRITTRPAQPAGKIIKPTKPLASTSKCNRIPPAMRKSSHLSFFSTKKGGQSLLHATQAGSSTPADGKNLNDSPGPSVSIMPPSKPRKEGFKRPITSSLPIIIPLKTAKLDDPRSNDNITIVTPESSTQQSKSDLIPLTWDKNRDPLQLRIIPSRSNSSLSSSQTDISENSSIARAIEDKILDPITQDLNLSDDTSSMDTVISSDPANTPDSSLEGEWLNTISLLNSSIKSITTNKSCITKDNIVLLLDATHLIINATPSD